MKKVKNIVTDIGRDTANGVSGAFSTVAFVGDVFGGLLEALARPKRIRWRDVLYYLDLCGRQSVPIVCYICVLMGVILGFQSAVQLQKYGAELFVADLLGFSILKELGPLMVAIIATGRAGSSFAAEIGTMKVSEELNALETMGIRPVRFLVVPKLLAMTVSLPLLAVIGDLAGVIGGLLVAIGYMNLPAQVYIARTLAVLSPSVLVMGILKTVVFAWLITLVGCQRGFAAGGDAQAVGRASTQAVVSGILAVVVADAVLTLLYMVWGY